MTAGESKETTGHTTTLGDQDSNHKNPMDLYYVICIYLKTNKLLVLLILCKLCIIYVCVTPHISIYIYIYIYICIYVYIYIYMYIYMNVYIYIHIFIYTHNYIVDVM